MATEVFEARARRGHRALAHIAAFGIQGDYASEVAAGNRQMHDDLGLTDSNFCGAKSGIMRQGGAGGPQQDAGDKGDPAQTRSDGVDHHY